MNRWWTYQKERFPLVQHGPLVAAFSFCAVSYAAWLEARTWPSPAAVGVAFFTSLFSFLHLRIADEFKDCEEDRLYRPYRPVPRGLVRLRELGWIWAGTAVLQAALALWHAPALLGWLFLTWTYLALMTREFFAADWLKARPLAYLFSHMLIMPLIDFYATACQWVPSGTGLPEGLWWFLAVSFGNGLTIEIGRKLRAPQDEETGVNTYTRVWGRERAIAAWLSTVLFTGLAFVLAAARAGFVLPASLIAGAALAGCGLLGVRFLRQPQTSHARALELGTGLWTLVLYLSLGFGPHLFAHE